jgi:hypothetical protein
MQHYHKNPRTITKKQFADLQDSLKRLGDLSGVVHDLSSDEIIGGNQRMDVFDLKTAQIELVERLDAPDAQGTVARGWVIWQGQKYTYRAVMWDAKTREEANIRANKAGGDWNMDILANQFEIPDLIEWGFKPFELGVVDEPIKPEDEWEGMPEFEQDDLMPARSLKINFLNEVDFEEFFKLVGQNFTDKTKSIWYPEIKREVRKNEVWKAQDE